MNINKGKHIKNNIIKIICFSAPALLLFMAFYLHNLTAKVLFGIAALLVFLLKAVYFKVKTKRAHYKFINMSPNERKQMTTQLKKFLNKKEAE